MKRTSLLWLPILVIGRWVLLSDAAEHTPAPVIHSIVIQGNKAIETAVLMKRITLRPGDPFTRNQLKFSVGVIESLYRDKGYYRVQVTTSTTAESPAEVRVYFRIEEGEL